jgi:hypothetical protein
MRDASTPRVCILSLIHIEIPSIEELFSPHTEINTERNEIAPLFCLV